MNPVTYERRGAAAVVTIDRQERRNAVDGPTADLLAEAYERFEAEDDARVMILTGAGDVAFCAGADLKAIESFGPRLERDGGPLGFTRRIATKPTIAAISGWCLAGGLELALWCDLRVATPTAALGFPERRWGVPLIDGGTQRLPRIVGPRARARPDPERPHRGGRRGARHGPRERDRARGPAPRPRRSRWPRRSRSFPQDTMLADRRAAIEGFDLPLTEALELEARSGQATLETAWRGAARFAGGEGRGGEGAGV